MGASTLSTRTVGPSETTSLLSRDITRLGDDLIPDSIDPVRNAKGSNGNGYGGTGTSTDGCKGDHKSGDANGSVVDGDEENGEVEQEDNPLFEGQHEMLGKMKLLFPAVAIGVSFALISALKLEWEEGLKTRLDNDERAKR